MGGLGFIQAGFLAAGAAVAVPLLIHLLFRQRARVVAIGSVRFLQQVVREHRRRRRVRQWLLLALRALVVLLLALLFARPFLRQSARDGLDSEVVILVDRSASMTARSSAGATLLDRALTEVRREIQRLDENSVVHLAWFDSAGVQELPLDQFFERTPPCVLGTDYGLALGWARDILESGGRSQRRVVLISDLQRGGLERSAIDPFDADTKLDVRDVGDSVTPDVAVLRADVPRTEIRPSEPIKARIVVRNGGALPQRQVRVEVRLAGPSGEIHSATEVDLPGGAQVVVELPLDVREAGIYRGEAYVESSDALDWDNRRFVAFEARPSDRVLLVDGQEGRSVFANETYFLETALRLKSNDSADRVGAFEVERIVWEAGQGFPRLDGFRALVLANVRRLSEEDLGRLQAYVRGGGSLVLFVGDQTSADQLASLRAAGLLAGRPADAPVSGAFRTSKWDAEHPALRLFQDPQRGDLRRLEFQRLWPLEPDPTARVLWSAGKIPVVVETPVERGRVIYFGVSADRDWSDWPRSRLFVPVVRQWMAYATGALADRSIVHLRTIDQPDQTPGISETAGEFVVHNIDSRESLLDRVTIDEFAAAAGTKVDDAAARFDTQQAALAAAPGAERPDEAWTLVVWALFVILTAELFLASRIHA